LIIFGILMVWALILEAQGHWIVGTTWLAVALLGGWLVSRWLRPS